MPSNEERPVETSLYWLFSRYYDPEIGRFISPDSVDYLDPNTINGLNLYAYCNNDPVNKVDPSGHFALLLFLGIVMISAVAGAIDGGVSAAISGQDFWKGFAAGAIGGAVGGVLGEILNYFVPTARIGNWASRVVSTLCYDFLNELFQTGKLDANNIGLYFVDVSMDVIFSMLYLDKVNTASGELLQTVADGVVDITQTLLYFSPQAKQSYRNTNNYSNKFSI